MMRLASTTKFLGSTALAALHIALKESLELTANRVMQEAQSNLTAMGKSALNKNLRLEKNESGYRIIAAYPTGYVELGTSKQHAMPFLQPAYDAVRRDFSPGQESLAKNMQRKKP